jgi:hypothetical protein
VESGGRAGEKILFRQEKKDGVCVYNAYTEKASAMFSPLHHMTQMTEIMPDTVVLVSWYALLGCTALAILLFRRWRK